MNQKVCESSSHGLIWHRPTNPASAWRDWGIWQKYHQWRQTVYHPKVPAGYIVNTGHNYICLSQFTQQITIQRTARWHSTNNFRILLPSSSGIMITSSEGMNKEAKTKLMQL